VGRTVTAVTRHGKWLDLATQDAPHLLAHLSRAGWLRWYDVAPATPVRPGKSPIALQYCPTCQTGGRSLADRRMSRLLR